MGLADELKTGEEKVPFEEAIAVLMKIRFAFTEFNPLNLKIKI